MRLTRGARFVLAMAERRLLARLPFPEAFRKALARTLPTFSPLETPFVSKPLADHTYRPFYFEWSNGTR